MLLRISRLFDFGFQPISSIIKISEFFIENIMRITLRFQQIFVSVEDIRMFFFPISCQIGFLFQPKSFSINISDIVIVDIRQIAFGI